MSIKKKEAEEAIQRFRNDISAIQDSYRRLIDSGMRKKTILVLLSHYTGIGQRTIDTVLDGLERLPEVYFGVEDE